MYRVDVRPRARRDMRHLQPKIYRQIQEKIDSLAGNPRPQDTKRVVTQPGVLRVDSGEYRIFYRVADREQLVVVINVSHRREAYR